MFKNILLAGMALVSILSFGTPEENNVIPNSNDLYVQKKKKADSWSEKFQVQRAPCVSRQEVLVDANAAAVNQFPKKSFVDAQYNAAKLYMFVNGLDFCDDLSPMKIDEPS
jgi:hypothetical protein